MSDDTKQRLTRLTKEQADEIMAHHGDLAYPRVFIGDDGVGSPGTELEFAL